MDRARLIIDPPAEGSWNMAVDQALLETADETGLITLRFYQWEVPTLSLGYFQNHKDRVFHPASLNCPMVRRRTGGGAIMHDRELTYSLCVPSGNRWSTKNGELYETIHRVIIELLKKNGCEAALYRDVGIQSNVEGGSTRGQPSESIGSKVDQNAFMCFCRRSHGDVVFEGFKIVGSAQRRAKNALLQHGSLLMETSSCSPELPGIKELSGTSLLASKTIEKLADLIGIQLRSDLNVAKLTELELQTAKRVRLDLFGNPKWNTRR